MREPESPVLTFAGKGISWPTMLLTAAPGKQSAEGLSKAGSVSDLNSLRLSGTLESPRWPNPILPAADEQKTCLP